MSQSLGPLSVGNVVSAALRVYRDHFKSYLGISAIACLWVLIPFLALIPLGIILPFLLAGTGGGDGNLGMLIILLLVAVPLWIFLLVYCVAKSLTNAALIARLVFGILNDKPETVTEVRSQLKPKTWIFWLTQLLLGIWLNIVCLPVDILRQAVNTLVNDSLTGLTILLVILVNLLYFCLYLWFYSRYFLPELPLALETNIPGPIKAIGRTWQLTKGFGWRILLIIAVAFLITLPVYILAGIPVFAAIFSLAASAANNDFNFAAFGGFILAVLMAIVIFIVLNIAALPFWQAIKAVIYYDLRSRREGLGLELRDS